MFNQLLLYLTLNVTCPTGVQEVKCQIVINDQYKKLIDGLKLSGGVYDGTFHAIAFNIHPDPVVGFSRILVDQAENVQVVDLDYDLSDEE